MLAIAANVALVIMRSLIILNSQNSKSQKNFNSRNFQEKQLRAYLNHGNLTFTSEI